MLWGLDKNGCFLTDESSQRRNSNCDALWNCLSAVEKNDDNIPDRIKSDIQDVIYHTKKEMERFHHMKLSDREKSKRILFHFQKDLMAGLSGQVLESQDRREEITQKPYSQTMKRCCWALLFAMNAGMLFYVFLFGVSRDGHHQAAWAKSFGIWLVMEILLVSSVMVLVMNVLVPMLTMKDIKKIKMKLVDTIVQYNRKLHERMDRDGDGSLLETSSTVFNAAQYLFVSYRLAREYPELRVSKIILAYETPWPRQSYLRTTQAVTQTYSRKFAAIYQAVTVLATYAITNFLTFPIHLQDMIVQISSTFVLGYTILVHLQLYQIYPVLIAVPTIMIAVVIHFWVRSSAAQEKIEIMKLLHYEKDQVPDSHAVMEYSHVVDGDPENAMDEIKPIRSLVVESTVDVNNTRSGVQGPVGRRQSIQIGLSLLQQGKKQLGDNDVQVEDFVPEVEQTTEPRTPENLVISEGKEKEKSGSSSSTASDFQLPSVFASDTDETAQSVSELRSTRPSIKSKSKKNSMNGSNLGINEDGTISRVSNDYDDLSLYDLSDDGEN